MGEMETQYFPAMSETLQQDGHRWDSMARLHRALDGLNSLPLPNEPNQVPPGPASDHPFFDAIRVGGYSPQLIEGLAHEFPDLAYVDGENGLVLTGSLAVRPDLSDLRMVRRDPRLP
jgi:hypothetical protein